MYAKSPSRTTTPELLVSNQGKKPPSRTRRPALIVRTTAAAEARPSVTLAARPHDRLPGRENGSGALESLSGIDSARSLPATRADWSICLSLSLELTSTLPAELLRAVVALHAELRLATVGEASARDVRVGSIFVRAGVGSLV